MISKRKRTIGFLFLGVALAFSAKSSAKVLTVCEALHNAKRLKGKSIIIAGRFSGSDMSFHGLELWDSGCQESSLDIDYPSGKKEPKGLAQLVGYLEKTEPTPRKPGFICFSCDVSTYSYVEATALGRLIIPKSNAAFAPLKPVFFLFSVWNMHPVAVSGLPKINGVPDQ